MDNDTCTLDDDATEGIAIPWDGAEVEAPKPVFEQEEEQE